LTAPEVLAWRSREAARRGDRLADVGARLELIVALCARGARRDAQALIARAEEDAFAQPGLALARAKARACLDRSGSLQELEAALRTTPDAEGSSILAEGLSRLGAWERAEAAFQVALDGAEERDHGGIALRRAENLVLYGRSREAIAALGPALEGSELVRLSALLLLSGLLLDAGEAERVTELASEAGLIAERRRNWFALSCAAMDAAAAWRLKGDDQRGVQILHATLTNIRNHGDPGVLLMARLVELQQEQRAAAT